MTVPQENYASDVGDAHQGDTTRRVGAHPGLQELYTRPVRIKLLGPSGAGKTTTLVEAATGHGPRTWLAPSDLAGLLPRTDVALFASRWTARNGVSSRTG